MATPSRTRFLSGQLRRHSADAMTTSSIAGVLSTLRQLGVASLNRQLLWLGMCSFLSGLAQASILVVVGEFAVNTAQGRIRLGIHGHSLGVPDAR